MNKISLFVALLAVAGCLTQEGVVHGRRSFVRSCDSIAPYKVAKATLNYEQHLDNGTVIGTPDQDFSNLTKELNARTGAGADKELTIVVTQTRHANNSDAHKWSMGMAGLTLFMLPYFENEMEEFSYGIYCENGLVFRDSFKIEYEKSICWFPLPLMAKGNGEDFYLFTVPFQSTADGRLKWMVDRENFNFTQLVGNIIDTLRSSSFENCYKALMTVWDAGKTKVAEKESPGENAQQKENKGSQTQSGGSKAGSVENDSSSADAEKDARRRRLASGGSRLYEFFHVEFGCEVADQMKKFGILPEDTVNPSIKKYRLGLEIEDFHKDIPGSRKFNGFRPVTLFVNRNSGKLIGIGAFWDHVTKGRDKMSFEAGRICTEITSIVGHAPVHSGMEKEHEWAWTFEESKFGRVRVELLAHSKDIVQDCWMYHLSIMTGVKTEGDNVDPRSSVTSGTGWFCAPDKVITCSHVVKGAINVFIQGIDGHRYKAKVLGFDDENDIAVLEIAECDSSNVLPISSKVEKISSRVFTLGYPMPGLLGSGQKYTDGVISSNSGIVGDRRTYQISVPIQPGNSGGALVNDAGLVVGVTSAGLNPIETIKLTGALPQGVNYAVKSRYVVGMLEDMRIPFKQVAVNEDRQSIVERVSKATVLVTAQRINEE